jgi:hypothetical protein
LIHFSNDDNQVNSDKNACLPYYIQVLHPEKAIPAILNIIAREITDARSSLKVQIFHQVMRRAWDDPEARGCRESFSQGVLAEVMQQGFSTYYPSSWIPERGLPPSHSFIHRTTERERHNVHSDIYLAYSKCLDQPCLPPNKEVYCVSDTFTTIPS